MIDDIQESVCDRHLALAIDIGGSGVRSGLVNQAGTLLTDSLVVARYEDRHVIEVIGSCIERTVSTSTGELNGVGVSCAGPILHSDGSTLCANLPELAGRDLRTLVAGVLGQIKVELELKPVVIELDGVCFAAAELWQGIGSDHDHFGVIVVSTGVGGGFVLDGRVYGGMSGNAGHIGQMGVTLPNTPNSTRRPTLDEEASGPGTVRWAQKSGWTGSSGEDLARDARAGDRRAIDAIYRSASLVGAAAIDVVTLLDLEIVVVGGGFALGSPLYLDAMRTAFQTSSVFHHLANVPIVEATFGTTACLIGAASLVWNTGVLQKSPYSSAMFGGRRR